MYTKSEWPNTGRHASSCDKHNQNWSNHDLIDIRHPIPDIVRHGRSDDNPQTRRDAEGALESAARLLGVPASANGAPSSGQRRILQGRQERDLEGWCKERGLWRESLTDFGVFVRGGEEHRVSPQGSVFVKATHPGRCGFTVIATPGGPTLTNALPAEYLHRLRVSNRVFNDDVRLVGATREDDALVIVTSQPTIVGEGATEEEMRAFFAALRFRWIPGFSAGYRGALSFYRDLDQVAVFDAHPANFLRDRSGLILPIDGVVVECDDQLATQVEALF